MLNIAILGCGRIGAMHADNIAAHPRATLAGVFDVHQPSVDAVCSKHGVTQFDSAEAAINAGEVDAILIASPTALHVDHIEMGVKAGKPILCEKPIDLSLERVNALKERISGANVPIMLGFVRRFDPGHAAAQQAAARGEIGEVHQVI
ncbi:MAG: Gfo/Idh/MocA family oxidoreductase, partial [Gammaproteobacteria bacterium]|nr:Gfo/Idh/MocA family oxidoreductase [Gammaproteobacteria bacterium]